MSVFRGLRRFLLPSFLGGQRNIDVAADADEGAVVGYSLGLLLDVFAERLRQGLRLRFPQYAHPSALPYLGRDRKILRGIGESADSYATRLVRAPDDHRVRGNPLAMLKQLSAYLQSDCMLATVDDAGNWYRYNVWDVGLNATVPGSEEVTLATGGWNWDGRNSETPRPRRFWVVIYVWSVDPPLVVRDGTWGDGETWGAKDDSTWGCTFTDEQVISIRTIVKEWKPAGTTCASVIVAFEAATPDFEPTNTLGSPGYWGQRSRNVAGVQVRSRTPDAIYMRGTIP